ncbi:hypothetical protein ACFQBY_01115 [Promicromonospora citrea]|uniref:UDP-N-acetylmuramyl pentapeptide phosphotransferase/UDP-N-acetylglucosamine-1-phosphate transferase n=1 Tax=Promicromonospora citrea TaxID=43677 RepID=A0A8H9GPF3_9MICO|nr:hypothetical protein [Promicromonospora citrea]GGM43097.1 hypothetical protein GCM10010102_43280 [Promicromonospora citrea]
MGAGRFVLAGAVAAAATVLARRTLEEKVAAGGLGGPSTWTRTNHRGEPISLLEGPAVTAGLVAGAVAGGGRAPGARAFATAAAGAFGLVDDLTEDTSERTKGFRGHLGALRQGRLTTGGLKILGISGSALLASAAGTPRTARTAFGHLVDIGLNGAIIGGTANLVNLFDLRPGRALKAGAAASLPVVAGGAGATGAVLGAAAAAAPGDLGERDMLGDGGANALGALVGSRVAFGAPRAVRWAALAGVVGLMAASEKVSFSKVIADNEWLNRIDMLGRRPVEPAPAPRPAAEPTGAPSTAASDPLASPGA